MNPTAVILKHPKGWFAAGAEVQQALTMLSDGAFKLFVYLCLNACRNTGVLETTQTELARSLQKGAAAIRAYLGEMETAGICRCQFSRSRARRGRVEVTPAGWPYQKPESLRSDDPAEAFLASLKKLLQVRAGVQSGFSIADEILARQWFQRGLSLERIEKAILLGCARQYASWRNDPRHGPIRSLRYFEPLLENLTSSLLRPATGIISAFESNASKHSGWKHTGQQNRPTLALRLQPLSQALLLPNLVPIPHRRSSTISDRGKKKKERK